MAMPSWFGRRPAPAQLDVAHSLHTAPGWRLWGRPVYTCIEPAQGPCADPDVLKAIQEFDPDVVPIWQVQAWLPPGKMGVDHVVNVAHVGLARYVLDRKGSNLLGLVTMPPGSGEAPNVLEFIWTDMGTTPKGGGPRDVWAFDWSLYAHCRSKFNANQSNLSMVTDYLDWMDEEDAKTKAQTASEMAYREKLASKAVESILHGVSHDELRAQYHAARQPGGIKGRVYSFQGR